MNQELEDHLLIGLNEIADSIYENRFSRARRIAKALIQMIEGEEMATVIYPCQCESEYQDKAYGKGNRIFNEGKGKCKCTVCGKDKAGGGFKSDDKKKEKKE